MKVLLTIAGFDPSSGAGVTADLAVFAAHGFFGASAITALTVQSTLGVRRSEAVAADLLRETLDCLAADFDIAGVKCGMLANDSNVSVVAGFLRANPVGLVVVDPVLRSSSGASLLDRAGLDRLRDELLPLSTWATPNRQEFAAIADWPADLNLVVTGGAERATDLVRCGGGETRLAGEYIDSRATHGTGCAFSSALLCGLAAGLDGVNAARAAKRYVAESIRTAPGLGGGNGPMRLVRYPQG